MRPRQFVPPVFAAVLLALVVGAPISALARIGLLGVAGTYAAANLVASVHTGRGGPFPEVLLLPVVFATLHLSYGFGFLAGLVRFRSRWSEALPGPPPARPAERSA